VKLSNLIKFTIALNNFRELLDETDLRNPQIPRTIKETRKITKVIVASSVEAERVFNLMNDRVNVRINVLLIENICHVTTMKLLGTAVLIGMRHHSPNRV
jgi:hypothetical protein